MKLWIKISSENRFSGAWFYNLENAKKFKRSWEIILPADYPNWPEVEGAIYGGKGEVADAIFTDLLENAYQIGFAAGKRVPT